MSRANEKLTPVHLAIEYPVAKMLKRQRTLQDKDLEWIFVEYRNYFQAVRQGKEPAEPDSTRSDRSAMMDFIWEGLLKFEERGGAAEVLDNRIMAGNRRVTTVEELYVMAFNDLRKSCRFHRKESGPRGYVRYVQEVVDQAVEQELELVLLFDPEVPLEMLERLTGGQEDAFDNDLLFERRGYRVYDGLLPPLAPELQEVLYEREEIPSEEVLRSLLIKYPDEPALLDQLAAGLRGEENLEERLTIYRSLRQRFRDKYVYDFQYLASFLPEFPERLLAEADALGFEHDLRAYPTEFEGGYDVYTLVTHANVSAALHLLKGDRRAAFQLTEDLLTAGFPDELMRSMGWHLLALDPSVNTDTPNEEIPEITDEEERLFPRAAKLVLTIQNNGLEMILDQLLGHSYPAAFDQQYPWPRNPSTVDQPLQLRVSMLGIEPEIYRTLVVPDDTLLPDLHGMIQLAFDWEDRHLHQFLHDGLRYDKDNGYAPAGGPGAGNAPVRIGELLTTVGDELRYDYDFGDGWQLRVVLEATPPMDDEILYPRCVAGARSAPPEDSGGVPGYQHKLAVLADPQDPEHEDIREWMGEDFDPEDFNLAWTHKQLWKGRFWHWDYEG